MTMDQLAEPRFWNDTIYTNIYRAVRYVSLLLVIHVALIAIDIVRLRNGSWNENAAYRWLFYAHLGTAAVLFVYCVLHRVLRPSSANDIRTCHAVMLIAMGSLLLLSCTVVTVIDQSIQGQITVYVLGVLILAAAVFVPLQISVPIFILNHCATVHIVMEIVIVESYIDINIS